MDFLCFSVATKHIGRYVVGDGLLVGRSSKKNYVQTTKLILLNSLLIERLSWCHDIYEGMIYDVMTSCIMNHALCSMYHTSCIMHLAYAMTQDIITYVIKIPYQICSLADTDISNDIEYRQIVNNRYLQGFLPFRPIFVWVPRLLNMIFYSHKNMPLYFPKNVVFFHLFYLILLVVKLFQVSW